jgi:peptidyl-tRNA hydrolase, PTH1 family
MKLICGLGNPGREYERHRHNVGFRVVDELSRRAGADLSQEKFEARIGQGTLGRERVVFLEPQTFMNHSGFALVPALRFYKIELADVLVVHDELDLPFGRIQVKAGGGAGGHNGLRSILEQLGEDGFARLRFGIGKPEGPNAKARVSGYVLSNFSPDEEGSLNELIVRAADASETWAREGISTAMNRFNRRQDER